MGVQFNRAQTVVKRRIIGLVCSVSFVALALSACGLQQDTATADNDTEGWTPEENVTFVVHTGAGGGADTFARAFESFLQDARPEVTVTVENREGGGGLRAYTDILQEDGNPHVLSVGMDTGLITLPIIQDAPFHWSDFTPIGYGEEFAAVVVTQPGAYEDLEELIARSQEEQTRVGLAGIAGPLSLATTRIEQEHGGDFDRVVFDAGSEIVIGVQSGDVEYGMPAPVHVIDPLEAGDIDALAILAEQRVEVGALADVPTGVEVGVDIVTPGFRGVTAPPGIPDEAREFWIETFEEWTGSDAHMDYLENALAIPSTGTGDDFLSYLEELEETVTPAAEAIE